MTIGEEAAEKRKQSHGIPAGSLVGGLIGVARGSGQADTAPRQRLAQEKLQLGVCATQLALREALDRVEHLGPDPQGIGTLTG